MSALREYEIERMLVRYFGIEIARDSYQQVIDCAVEIGDMIQEAREEAINQRGIVVG